MKIIVLGAGQVGSTVAQNLAVENNDVTVVDTDRSRLQELQNRLDLNTVVGHAAYPNILAMAGAEDAEMVVAATNSDETNMIACQVAYSLFRTPTKIARVRSQAYMLKADKLFRHKHIPIDVLISPERLVTDHIERIIEHPGAFQVIDFADGLVRLVGVVAEESAPMTGRMPARIHDLLPDTQVRIAALYRDNVAIIPGPDTIIQTDDIVFYIAARENTVAVMQQFHKLDQPSRHVMIAGGGNIGCALAQRLEQRYKVKVIEKHQDRALELAELLDRAMVLNGDVADQHLLAEENVGKMDLFCALTNDDEANILSAMVARKMGSQKVLSLINRPAYVELVERGFIDLAISPHSITIGALLTHIRRGDVVAVHSLRRGSAEALEAIAHGDEKTSQVVGRRITDLPLPDGAIIGAIVRGTEVTVATDEFVIEAGDHLIVLVVDKSDIADVENLFQVGVTY